MFGERSRPVSRPRGTNTELENLRFKSILHGQLRLSRALEKLLHKRSNTQVRFSSSLWSYVALPANTRVL